MHQTTYLATLTDETPEQKLIHFTFKNLSLLQDAINQAVCTLFSIQEIRWNTLKAFCKECFYGFYVFHGKTRTIDLLQLCYDSYLRLLSTYNEFRPYILYYSTNPELIIAFKSIFRILLNTSDKTALRNAMNLHGIGSHSLRSYALSKTLLKLYTNLHLTVSALHYKVLTLSFAFYYNYVVHYIMVSSTLKNFITH